MKILFTILIIMFSKVVAAQCDTADTPPIPVILYMKMNTKYFDYYNSDGVPLWKKQLYDSTLIPPGGFAWRITTDKKIEGYVVLKVIDTNKCLTGVLKFMDLNMKVPDGMLKYYEYKR
mgnify:FL=1